MRFDTKLAHMGASPTLRRGRGAVPVAATAPATVPVSAPVTGASSPRVQSPPADVPGTELCLNDAPATKPIRTTPMPGNPEPVRSRLRAHPGQQEGRRSPSAWPQHPPALSARPCRWATLGRRRRTRRPVSRVRGPGPRLSHSSPSPQGRSMPWSLSFRHRVTRETPSRSAASCIRHPERCRTSVSR